MNDTRLAEIPPHERQQGTFDSMRAFLVGESQRQPVVVFLDDLQWIDATSEAFLQHLTGSIAAHRLLLIACSRLDYDPSWGRHPAVVPVVLSPLDGTERRRMIEGRVDAATLLPELMAAVAERSEGNPFFLEELLTALGERVPRSRDGDERGCEEAAPIPATVEEVIAARIDRLDDGLKRVLQVAAVIGREFEFDLLRAVAGAEDALRRHVMRLVELELVREVSIFPTWTFAFKSSLAHAVAYRTLLLGRRRDMHARVARAIETRTGADLEEACELIAYHLARSADAEAAARYLIRAGDKAVRHFATADARRYYDDAEDLLERLPEPATDRLARELQERRERLIAAEMDATSA